MKKIIIALFALLLLVGCSNEKGYSHITNGDEVIFKGPETTYTKADLYEVLKVASEDSIETDILNRIATNLNIDYSDVEQEVDEMIELYESMGYTDVIVAYYGSVEAFKEMYIQSSVINKLGVVYVEENYDEFKKADKPVSMQYVYFDSQETADAFINDVTTNGKDFETAATDNGFESDCSVGIFLDSDNLPLNIKSYLNETVDLGISKIIVVTDETTDSEGNTTEKNTYYVLNVISRDAEEFKDDYIQAKINSVGEDAIKNYMFEKHEIKFYDQDIYEIMKKAYEVFE